MNDELGHKPIARDIWENFAEAYAAKVRTKFHNAIIERPATLSLLPDVRGKRVLDAGCGPGIYSEILVNSGAEVVAIDMSPKMIEIAKRALKDKVTFHIVNMEDHLDFLEDESFDLILSSLALDYIYDWNQLFLEFNRVLHKNGIFVFSVGNPVADIHLEGSRNYFEIEEMIYTWTGFDKPVDMHFYRRPFQAIITPLLKTGFIIEDIIESRPVDAGKEIDPQEYEKTFKAPTFICFRVRKSRSNQIAQ